MTFFNRPSPRRPALQQWPQTDDFADFEARVERGEAGNTSQVRYVAQAGVGKAAGAPQPSQSEKLRQFQSYMKNNYGISDQDAARMLGVWGAWQANPANWRLGTPLGMTKNVNGQVSPTQDRMTRSIIDSARDKEFRDRVLSGYEEAIRKGQVKIVDDPTKK